MATHSSILAWIIPWTEECYSPRGGKKSKGTEGPEEKGFQVPEGHERPLQDGKAVPCPWKTGPMEVSFEGDGKGKEQS